MIYLLERTKKESIERRLFSMRRNNIMVVFGNTNQTLFVKRNDFLNIFKWFWYVNIKYKF
jgi:hypothetical protein